MGETPVARASTVRPPFWRTIRARLAMRHAAMLAVVVLLIEAASYLAVARLLAQRGDRLLESASSALLRDLRTELERGKPVDDAIATAVHDVRFGDVAVTVRALPAASAAQAAVYVTRAGDDTRGDARVRTEVVTAGPVSLEVIATRSLFEDQETLEAVQRAYLVAVALAILLSAFVMWRLATAALSPIEALAERAATLGSGDLHERLRVSSPDDEVGRLTRVLNGMLERIDNAFAQQRQFVADASHELRTPVAVLRTELDVTRANAARTPEEYRETLARLDRVTARMERLVADLFLLARVDAGGANEPQLPLEMATLVQNTADLLHGIADERGVMLVVRAESHTMVRGNESQLERVLLNLLDNALRYAPRGSAITLSVVREGPYVVTDVRDTGPGIEPTLQATLFDRFRRRMPLPGEPAYDGAGLGLAIAQALVKTHGGELLLLQSSEAGSTFRVRLLAVG